MKQVLTLVCKLRPTPEAAQKIESTLVAFADAYNYTNQEVKPNITRKTTIQNIVYQTIREKKVWFVSSLGHQGLREGWS